jgi:hypothetical protein
VREERERTRYFRQTTRFAKQILQFIEVPDGSAALEAASISSEGGSEI